MGIKYNEETKMWEATHSARHPITNQPLSRKRINLKSKAEAMRVEKELVIIISDKLRAQTKPSWLKAVDEFCESKREGSFTEKTIEDYFTCLKAHTFQPWQNKLVDEISTNEIRELVRGKDGSHAPGTQKNILKMIRGVFKYCVEQNYIDREPTPTMKFQLRDKIKGVLNERQVIDLLRKAQLADTEWYPIWAMALYTGMRNGELYALTWDKVDFDQNTILVNQSWNKKDGLKSTKSGDDRKVAIAPSLLTMLRELKLKSDSVYVLPRAIGWENGYQAQQLKHFLISMNVPPVRFHDLRASWATMLLNKGIEPVKVMAMGGWKDIKTMMIYMRKAGVDIKGSTNCLELHDPDFVAGKVVNLSFGSAP